MHKLSSTEDKTHYALNQMLRSIQDMSAGAGKSRWKVVVERVIGGARRLASFDGCLLYKPVRAALSCNRPSGGGGARSCLFLSTRHPTQARAYPVLPGLHPWYIYLPFFTPPQNQQDNLCGLPTASTFQLVAATCIYKVRFLMDTEKVPKCIHFSLFLPVNGPKR